MLGKYESPKQLPSVPGFEGSGLVIETGGGYLANRLIGKKVSFTASTVCGTYS